MSDYRRDGRRRDAAETATTPRARRRATDGERAAAMAAGEDAVHRIAKAPSKTEVRAVERQVGVMADKRARESVDENTATAEPEVIDEAAVKAARVSLHSVVFDTYTTVRDGLDDLLTEEIRASFDRLDDAAKERVVVKLCEVARERLAEKIKKATGEHAVAAVASVAELVLWVKDVADATHAAEVGAAKGRALEGLVARMQATTTARFKDYAARVDAMADQDAYEAAKVARPWVSREEIAAVLRAAYVEAVRDSGALTNREQVDTVQAILHPSAKERAK
jgi:hypothetical protein